MITAMPWASSPMSSCPPNERHGRAGSRRSRPAWQSRRLWQGRVRSGHSAGATVRGTSHGGHGRHGGQDGAARRSQLSRPGVMAPSATVRAALAGQDTTVPVITVTAAITAITPVTPVTARSPYRRHGRAGSRRPRRSQRSESRRPPAARARRGPGAPLPWTDRGPVRGRGPS
jgi:hypothetical protein